MHQKKRDKIIIKSIGDKPLLVSNFIKFEKKLWKWNEFDRINE